MTVVRYLNGKRLHGAMPPLVLGGEAVGALLSQACQQLPLPTADGFGILSAEDSTMAGD